MILVIAEQRDGKLNRATWETIAAAQQLAGTAQQLAGGMPITVAVLGAATGGVAQEARRRRRLPKSSSASMQRSIPTHPTRMRPRAGQ